MQTLALQLQRNVKILRGPDAGEIFSTEVFVAPYSIILLFFSDSFRQHAFLPLVRAPRVILLVHDDQSKTQTTVLVTTIISAWPMLIFILVTALFSGIVLWFLVSDNNIDIYTVLCISIIRQNFEVKKISYNPFKNLVGISAVDGVTWADSLKGSMLYLIHTLWIPMSGLLSFRG
jgi:hypothetical protein